MARRVFVVLLFASFAFVQLASAAALQLGTSQGNARSLTVRVTFANGGSCDSRLQVSLVGDNGAPVLDGFSNHECMVEFSNVPSGNYHVSVFGGGIENAAAGNVAVASQGNQQLEVKVNTTAEEKSREAAMTSPLVAAADLKIPDRARKEFDKATELIARQDWNHATERLKRAIAIYPDYAEAYNNLGIAYIRLGDQAQGREALQKAVGTNDHLASAYVNLARMSIANRDFPAAETLLDKATAIDPNDAATLVLLADAQLMNRRYGDALATCRKAHSNPQAHALAHYIAARAFEAEHKATDAIAELQTYLSEEEDGPRAEAARKEMAALQVTAR